jgi:hypothetical protein
MLRVGFQDRHHGRLTDLQILNRHEAVPEGVERALRRLVDPTLFRPALYCEQQGANTRILLRVLPDEIGVDQRAVLEMRDVALRFRQGVHTFNDRHSRLQHRLRHPVVPNFSHTQFQSKFYV